MLAADSTQINGLTYNLYTGLTGQVSRQNGRFITLVAQAIDSAHHRTFVRRVELIQESFAKFAYFSNNENGICFGSGDVLAGPVFSNGTIANCAGQNATFEDSVQAVISVDSEAPGVYVDGYQAGNPPIAPISMPNTSGLASLFTIATAGSTNFTSPNATTDSTSDLHSRLEFVAYNDTTPTLAADSIQKGEGFVRFYQIDEGNSYWTAIPAAKRDSSAASYLRSGINHYADPRNCGDWHFVFDSITGSAGTFNWEFFPATVHDSAWFQTAEGGTAGLSVHGGLFGWQSGDNVYHAFVRDTGAAVHMAGLDSSFLVAYHVPAGAHAWLTSTFVSEKTAISGGNPWSIWMAVITPARDTNPNYPSPTCFPAGDPHLVAVERTSWRNAVSLLGYGHKGGVDSTFTYGNGGGPGTAMPAGSGLGHWSVYPGTVTWANASFKSKHLDWAALYPIDQTLNPAFQGVVAVHGSTGISGNVDGHITVYSDGNIGIVDNLRLVTGTTDTLCNHGLGIVSGNDITAVDNGINVPQHWTPADAGSTTMSDWVDLRPNNGGTAGTSPFGGSLYVQSTVMALGSWGAEGLNPDTNYVSTVYCNAAAPPDYYKRGCLYVFGSIIQNTRQTVNSGSGGPGGYGYAKAYSYDICAVANPLPYFPTTGRLIENKYYELSPNNFNVTNLFLSLQGP
jgi:hypothetical protein